MEYLIVDFFTGIALALGCCGGFALVSLWYFYSKKSLWFLKLQDSACEAVCVVDAESKKHGEFTEELGT